MNITAPKIRQSLTPRNFHDFSEQEEPLHEYAEIIGSDFSNEAAGRVQLYQSIIKNCLFIQTDFQHIDLLDVHFESCDFSNADLRSASIHRVTFN